MQLEGSKFGRRVPLLLPLLARALKQEAQAAGDGDSSQIRPDDESAETRLSDWQEAYSCLLLLERLATAVPSQVRLPALPSSSHQAEASTLEHALLAKHNRSSATTACTLESYIV